VRDASRLDPSLHDLVEVREGDLRDRDYVLAATAGVDALSWIDPTDLAADDPNAVTVEAARGAAEAVERHGIGRVVFQSSVGAERQHGVGLIDGLAAAEGIFRATDADVRVLRCGYFFTNLSDDVESLRAGVLTTAMTPDRRLPWVAPRDVVEVTVGSLLGDWTGDHVQAVHGPEDLSFREVAATVSEATGHEVALQVVDDAAVREALTGLGLPAGAVDGIVGMTAGIRDGFTPADARSVLTTTPTTLGEWAYATLRPLLVDPAAAS
jgi:uncharacterized protein YbjT (DUF2867 family)